MGFFSKPQEAPAKLHTCKLCQQNFADENFNKDLGICKACTVIALGYIEKYFLPADRIFYALDKIGMEQKALAAAIGTFPSTVSGWKTGKTKSYKNYLPKIAEVLHISADYLLTGAEKEPTTVSGDGSWKLWNCTTTCRRSSRS